MDKTKKYYVTTPIYYVTAAPHLGSLYSTVLADVVARWQKLCNKETFFLTGTDEHGQKIAQAAEKAHKSPKEFVDSFIPAYLKIWDMYNIKYNHFIRTTDPKHIQGVEEFIQKLLDNGSIYKGSYQGWYCTPCETFVAEKQSDAEEAPLCPTCGRQTQIVSEETYFFRLSAYQQKLLDFYATHPDFIVPHERANEVISFVQAGLKDLSISRTTVQWGIPFPHDPRHVVYVWIDALANYITAVGYGDHNQKRFFDYWWPADLHIIGKDIVRFHAVFWPAFLMAAELPLPKQLLVHGWIKINQQKMSKSFGNVVDPVELHATYGTDAIRYYLVRQLPVNQDGDFSIADLEQRITSDLANDLGNLLQRMVSLADKHGIIDVPEQTVWSLRALDLRDAGWNMIQDVCVYMNESQFHLALAAVWKYIHQLNAYFHEMEPWKLINKDKQAFMEVLSVTCHGLRMVGVLLWPIMPQSMEALVASIGAPLQADENITDTATFGSFHKSFLLHKIPALFKKPLEREVDTPMQEKSAEQGVEKQYPEITIEELQKVMLAVGTIESCDMVPKSDKLLQLKVNFGPYGIRQIMSGIRAHFSPEQLIGRQAVFVLNLKPRKVFGYESQGMLLIAPDESGALRLSTVAEPVANGSLLR